MSGTAGHFITFEGGEGAGKSTQIARLAERLKNHHLTVLVTREPGGSEGAEEIRKLLVNGPADRWDAVSELLLLYAARRDHVERMIKPALMEGTWVLCDRFADSTLAYQGRGRGLGFEIGREIHRVALGDFWPELTFLLDMPPETGLARTLARNGGETRFESMTLAFHQRLREGFQQLAAQEPNRFVSVEATADVEAIAERLWRVVSNRFGIESET